MGEQSRPRAGTQNPTGLSSPSCPVTHARCSLVIFAVECASPSDSPGEQGLKLPPLLTQLPHLRMGVFGGGQGKHLWAFRVLWLEVIRTLMHPLHTRPHVCVCMCNI